MQKFIAWIKKYWAVVLAVLTAVFGFVIGRKSLRLSDNEAGQDRQNLLELRDQLIAAQIRATDLVRIADEQSERIVGLEGDNGRKLQLIEKQRANIERLESGLGEAKDALSRADKLNEGNAAEIDEGRKISGGIRATLESLRTELESIQLPDDRPARGDPL